MPARPDPPYSSAPEPRASASGWKALKALGALGIAAVGCTEAPSAPIEIPVAVPAPSVEATRTAPESAPARWFRRRGRNLWGPTIGDATLVLLGGRRAL